MPISVRRVLTLSSAIMALGLGGFAIAAPDAPITPPPAKAHQDHHDMAARAQKLREKLGLTPAQEPALQAFMSARTPPASGAAAMPDRGAWKTQRQKAAETFRAQLTPAQQATFDAMRQKHMAHEHGKGPAEPLH